MRIAPDIEICIYNQPQSRPINQNQGSFQLKEVSRDAFEPGFPDMPTRATKATQSAAHDGIQYRTKRASFSPRKCKEYIVSSTLFSDVDEARIDD
jgi:hypothetical protein